MFLHEPGGDIVRVDVDLDPEAPGFDVECLDCGRRAKMEDDPGGRGALCPGCLIAEVERIESRRALS